MTWEAWAAAKQLNSAWAGLANHAPQTDWWGLFWDALGMADMVARLVMEVRDLQ